MILQFCGLSGAGKSTLAKQVKNRLSNEGYPVEIIDGDEYRNAICKGLGFSKEERYENVRRLGFVASKLSAYGIITIISAINPYNEIRTELKVLYPDVKTVFIDCSLEKLICRDTKGLYKKALLPKGHPEKICNLTGVNDQFDVPPNPDIYINTDIKNIKDCTDEICEFITGCLVPSYCD